MLMGVNDREREGREGDFVFVCVCCVCVRACLYVLTISGCVHDIHIGILSQKIKRDAANRPDDSRTNHIWIPSWKIKIIIY